MDRNHPYRSGTDGGSPAADASGHNERQNGNMRVAVTIFGLGAALCAVAANSTARADDLNDYPTTARADYVFGCMKANGETRRALEQCSCSVDVIATLLPYERYVTAETVLSMAQVPGTLGNQFRSTEFAKAAVDELRRAQAEAEVRCF
jgi:hypothetical protein